MSYKEYVVEKQGLGKIVYFIAAREVESGWVAGFFPAYMAPNPGEDSDDEMFDIANPDHTEGGPTQEAAEEALRAWVEKTYTVHERRTERKA